MTVVEAVQLLGAYTCAVIAGCLMPPSRVTDIYRLIVFAPLSGFLQRPRMTIMSASETMHAIHELRRCFFPYARAKRFGIRDDITQHLRTFAEDDTTEWHVLIEPKWPLAGSMLVVSGRRRHTSLLLEYPMGRRVRAEPKLFTRPHGWTGVFYHDSEFFHVNVYE